VFELPPTVVFTVELAVPVVPTVTFPGPVFLLAVLPPVLALDFTAVTAKVLFFCLVLNRFIFAAPTTFVEFAPLPLTVILVVPSEQPQGITASFVEPLTVVFTVEVALPASTETFPPVFPLAVFPPVFAFELTKVIATVSLFCETKVALIFKIPATLVDFAPFP